MLQFIFISQSLEAQLIPVSLHLEFWDSEKTIVKTVNLVPFSNFSIAVHVDPILVAIHHDAIDIESRDLNLRTLLLDLPSESVGENIAHFI